MKRGFETVKFLVLHCKIRLRVLLGALSSMLETIRMYDTCNDIGQKESKEQRDTLNTQALTSISTRNRLTNPPATATPLQRYCRHPHRMPERLMYHTGAAMGEKASKERRVTNNRATKSTYLVITKIALRLDLPHLRHSDGIAVILIEFLID